jgi:hypothetical protein
MTIGKAHFRQIWRRRDILKKENLLFEVLDQAKDDALTNEDFYLNAQPLFAGGKESITWSIQRIHTFFTHSLTTAVTT